MKSARCFAAAIVLGSTTGAYALTSPVASYSFNNSFASSVAGAPSLTAVNPNGTSGFVTDTVFGKSQTVYSFSGTRDNAGQAGLILDLGSLLTSKTVYTVQMTFEFTQGAGAWRRILDVQSRASDVGFYVSPSDNLYVFPTGGGASFSNNVYHDVFLSNNNGAVTFYLDGSAQATVSSTVMNIDANNQMYLFLDNIAGSAQGEYASGRIAGFNLYNAAITPSDAGPGTTIPPVTAVPEPATVALMAGGLGLVGFVARRRKTA